MDISLDELNNNLLSLDMELTPMQIAWLREHYGDELAEKFAKKKKMKKNLWLLMQNNNVLRALVSEHKILKKQALQEIKVGRVYNARLYKTKRTVSLESERGL